MGKIADKARELGIEGFTEIRLANVIDFEFATLRQEIRDLKRDIKDGSASTLDYKEPKPDLQRGDFVSCMDEDKKTWGIFHHQIKDIVWGYFQDVHGKFTAEPTWVCRDEVTFEFRPKK